MKLRSRTEEARLEGELARAQKDLTTAVERVDGLAVRERELNSREGDAIVSGCEHEHERERRAFEIEKVAATTERDRAQRRVEAFSSRIDEIERERQEAARQEIRDELAELRARREQFAAAVAATDAKVADAEERLDDVDSAEPDLRDIEWHVRARLQGLPTPPMTRKLARVVEARCAVIEARRESDRLHAAEAALQGVRLPSGGPGYMRMPGPADGAFPVALDPERRL